jgi:hypothetical protein
MEFVRWWLIVECRSTAEAAELEAGNCMEDRKVGFVRVLLKGTPSVVFS